MTNRFSLASALLTVFAAFLALVLATTPAIAHHKSDHEQGKSTSSQGSGSDHDGDADSDSNTSYTEDNDTNDNGTKNNVSDEGDNRHPSGKDRSVENGGSGNQGNSESDPDDDGRGPDRSNGGPDKPNGSGGVDKADQDGNNGCGNDDDFEDDNEGWCGRKPKDEQKPAVLPTPKPTPSVTPTGTPSPCPSPMTYPTTSAGTCGTSAPTPGPNEVLGDEPVEPKDCPIETMASDEKDCEAVLGEVIGNGDDSPADDVEAGGVGPSDAAAERPALGAAMPFTGANLVLFLVLALGLLGVGVALFRTRRN